MPLNELPCNPWLPSGVALNLGCGGAQLIPANRGLQGLQGLRICTLYRCCSSHLATTELLGCTVQPESDVAHYFLRQGHSDDWKRKRHLIRIRSKERPKIIGRSQRGRLSLVSGVRLCRGGDDDGISEKLMMTELHFLRPFPSRKAIHSLRPFTFPSLVVLRYITSLSSSCRLLFHDTLKHQFLA